MYSHKFKKSALRYEVALNIQTGDICNIEGPYPPGIYNDQLIFEDALELALEAGECVETDRGYRGAFSRGTVQCPPYEVPERRGMTATVRNRHETCNKRFKHFNILKAPYRHDLFDHQAVFGAVACLTQFSFENGDPLFPVHYQD